MVGNLPPGKIDHCIINSCCEAQKENHLDSAIKFYSISDHYGGIRAKIESVRIPEGLRREGLGQKMSEWAIQKAKQWRN